MDKDTIKSTLNKVFESFPYEEFCKICLKKYLWAEFRGTKAGIKLHQRIVLHDGKSYPDKATLTPAKPADRSQLDELINTATDALNVFDRGYVDYKKWDAYCEQGVRFISRLKANAIVDVIESKTIQTNDNLITESIVVLGNPNTTRMKYPLRLFETQDNQGNTVIIVTNDFGLDALEITEIYRLRWQVELFFKWIKQHLKVKKFFGNSPNAVYGQIWIALITFCLLRLLQTGLPFTKTLLEVLRAVKHCLHQPFSELVDILGQPPTKASRGRRSLHYEKDVEILLKEFEVDDTSFLSDISMELYA